MTDDVPRVYANVNDIPWFREAVAGARMHLENHNHITRDIKPAGQCYSCDRYHAKVAADTIYSLEEAILFTEELYETYGAEAALRHLQAFIRTEHLAEKHRK